MSAPRNSASGDRRGRAAAHVPAPGTLGRIGEAVMIRHTLFSLPFAVMAVILVTNGRPDLADLLWIVLAAAGARNAANALNRLIDRRIDARNPRTAGRHLPAGTLSPRALVAFTVAMLALLVVSAAMLNPLCVVLLPLAGVLVFGYSYTKRFTWLCHWWLGVTCSAATLGAFLGIAGRIEWRFLPLTAGVALWVAGFDILYATQDIEFDRREGLYSVPARFGLRGARAIASATHAAALVGMAGIFLFRDAAAGRAEGPGIASAAALAVFGALLASEHIISRKGTERHIRIAAYGINEILPLIMLAGVAIDTYLL